MSLITPDLKTRFDQIVSHYPSSQAAMIPVLHILQARDGYLKKEAITEVADYLKVPVSKVEEVVSFYTMLATKPRGKHHLMVCRTLSCGLGGCQVVVETIRQKLGINPGETSADGKFSLEQAECLAACDIGPVMQVGERYYGNLTAEKTAAVLDELAKK